MIKKVLYHFLYFFEQALSIFFSPKQRKTLIVIRTDAIGDYILFRNFFKPLYDKYGKFTLIGNIAFQDLVEQLDCDYIDEFIPINRKLFARNLLYRFKLIKKIRTSSYQILINPIYSRDRISEDIAKIVNARRKITSQGDTSNLSSRLKEKYDKNYSLLLPVSNKVLFEFYRNLSFIRKIFKKNIKVNFFIKLDDSKKFLSKHLSSTPYSVLFIGASDQCRKWKWDNFAEIGKFLNLNYNDNIVICGGNEDFKEGQYIQKKLTYYNIKSTNLCGKTSLFDLVQILDNMNFLISNETSAVHIAMSLQCSKIFVISNGNHLYRFAPYPKELKRNSYHLILHPTIQNNSDKSYFSGKASTLNINEIDVSMVEKKILEKYPIKLATASPIFCYNTWR